MPRSEDWNVIRTNVASLLKMRPFDKHADATLVNHWMVVTTHPSREEYATQNLERQGFTVYYPRIIKRVSHARRTYDAARPLFPSYLFVANSALGATRWRSLLSTFGVRTLVRRGEIPSLISNDFIASLKAREVEGVLRLPERPYAVGQEVRIQGGAFNGLVGTILELRENQRIVVLMRLLNQQSKVLLTADGLSPV